MPDSHDEILRIALRVLISLYEQGDGPREVDIEQLRRHAPELAGAAVDDLAREVALRFIERRECLNPPTFKHRNRTKYSWGF